MYNTVTDLTIGGLKMKKFTRVLLATLTITLACAAPVFATEKNLSAEINLLKGKDATVSNALDTITSFDNNCGNEAKLAIHTIVDIADSDITKGMTEEQLNYIDYLKKVVVNLKETERIKKGNVAALTDLVKVNPSFQKELDAAVVEYNKAVADRVAGEQAIITAQEEFAKLNAALKDAKVAKGAKDADSVK